MSSRRCCCINILTIVYINNEWLTYFLIYTVLDFSVLKLGSIHLYLTIRGCFIEKGRIVNSAGPDQTAP